MCIRDSYMLRGYSFAEASALANPGMGWKSIASGDPLYAPMAAKTPVKDTFAPTLASGYPSVEAILDSSGIAFRVRILVNDSPEPEAVKAKIEYGTSAAYG